MPIWRKVCRQAVIDQIRASVRAEARTANLAWGALKLLPYSVSEASPKALRDHSCSGGGLSGSGLGAAAFPGGAASARGGVVMAD